MANTTTSRNKGKERAMDVDPPPDASKSTGADRVEDSELSFDELVDAIVQFLEVAFHTVLYMRGVYPAEIFKLHRIYSHPVYRSRHPGLNEYISGLLSSIRYELQRGRLSKVILVLSSTCTSPSGIDAAGRSQAPSSSPSAPETIPLERYVFELAYLLPRIPRSSAARNLSIRGNLTFRELTVMFRAFLMKLAVMDASLEDIVLPTPGGKAGEAEDSHPSSWELGFAVVVEMREEGMLPGPQEENDGNVPDEGPWVPADDELATGRRRAKEKDREEHEGEGEGEVPLRARRRERRQTAERDGDGAIVLPVKSLDSGVINLTLYVEDNPSSKTTLRRYGRGRYKSSKSKGKGKSKAKSRSSKRRRRAQDSADPTSVLSPDLDLYADPARSRSGRRRPREDADANVDIEDLLARDAGGSRPRGHARGRVSRRAGSPSGLSASSSSSFSDSDSRSGTGSGSDSESQSSGSNSSSDDLASDSGVSEGSIQSVGDFAGYGGAGAGRGGGGMNAGW